MKVKRVVFAIGRWMPIHLGHKNFLVNLAREYDRLVVGIGSCYENGTPRNCIPAVEREKLLRQVFRAEGIPDSRIRIVPVQDRPTFEQWIDDVVRICRRYHVTHFCTGNKEDILSILDEKGIRLDMEMIDPEVGSPFPFHATEIRRAIVEGRTELLDRMLPAEIRDAVIRQVSREIVAANEGRGREFIPGRQTTDMVFLVRDPADEKDYILLGTRNAGKKDFPNTAAIPGGKIREFESPVNAVARMFYTETGLRVKIADNTKEPADVLLPQLSDRVERMWFTGIYASPDTRVNGTRGGGSQCFAVYLRADIAALTPLLYSRHDMEDLRFVPVKEIPGMDLAFQQKDMVIDTLRMLDIDYQKAEALAVVDACGHFTGESVSRAKAHSDGVPHGAAHIYVWRKNAAGETEVLLQRRSHNKDSYPDCLDTSSAGHVEAGMDYLSTALKELEEELGLTPDAADLAPGFDQSIHTERLENGKPFIDREYNRVYFLQADPPRAALRLQKEEVSEVVWLPLSEITARIAAQDAEICVNPAEWERAAAYLKGVK